MRRLHENISGVDHNTSTITQLSTYIKSKTLLYLAYKHDVIRQQSYFDHLLSKTIIS